MGKGTKVLVAAATIAALVLGVAASATAARRPPSEIRFVKWAVISGQVKVTQRLQQWDANGRQWYSGQNTITTTFTPAPREAAGFVNFRPRWLAAIVPQGRTVEVFNETVSPPNLPPRTCAGSEVYPIPVSPVQIHVRLLARARTARVQWFIPQLGLGNGDCSVALESFAVAVDSDVRSAASLKRPTVLLTARGSRELTSSGVGAEKATQFAEWVGSITLRRIEAF